VNTIWWLAVAEASSVLGVSVAELSVAAETETVEAKTMATTPINPNIHCLNRKLFFTSPLYGAAGAAKNFDQPNFPIKLFYALAHQHFHRAIQNGDGQNHDEQ
jgi:hypothetical protein